MRYTKASRHRASERSSRSVRTPAFRHGGSWTLLFPRRAFSLVEVLLAVFILAIGIISIASLFPAGIAQQRLSTDDSMGPVVADHAMSVIRSKVKPEDFGTFEDYRFFFGAWAPQAYFTRTTEGDWGWMRPGFLLSENSDTDFDERGAIDIFSHYFVRQRVHEDITTFVDGAKLVTEFASGWPQDDFWSSQLQFGSNDPPLWGIPFSREASLVDWWDRRENVDGVPTPPRRIITQHERYYPMQTDMIHPALAEDPDFRLERRRPEYVWECMFRRFNGRIQVAIFVYRVSSVEARDARWRVPQNDSDFWGDRMPDDIESFPPLPVRLDFVNPNSPSGIINDDLYPEGPWDVWYSSNAPHQPVPFVPGVDTNLSGVEFNLDDPHQSWQQHRQWLLDQNNNVHRVVGQQFDPSDLDFPVRIELSRHLQPIRVHPRWRNTLDPGVPFNGGFASPFQDWPWNSQIPAEYYADIPDPFDTSSPAPRDVSSYADYVVSFPDEPPPFFNWETSFDRGVVTRIWYIPRTVVDVERGIEWRLTPVYVTVKEL